MVADPLVGSLADVVGAGVGSGDGDEDVVGSGVGVGDPEVVVADVLVEVGVSVVDVLDELVGGSVVGSGDDVVPEELELEADDEVEDLPLPFVGSVDVVDDVVAVSEGVGSSVGSAWPPPPAL